MSPDEIFKFGVFELDTRERELRNKGRRVHLQDQPFELLKVLIERRGELVSRDELRRILWPADTFVAFDDSLNTAVRKVRDALGDAADSSRFVETIPRRGYRFIAEFTRSGGLSPSVQSGSVIANQSRAEADDVRAQRSSRGALAVVLFGSVVASLAVGVGLSRQSAGGLVRASVLTTLSGTEFMPTWSPDGRLIAFAADANGTFDIWVRQIGSDTATVLSEDDDGQDTNPAWSPDGATIAFASERDGGGIYTVPAIGGRAKRLLPLAFTPSPDLIGSVPALAWSPDSSRLAYAYGIEGHTGLWVLTLSTGIVRQIPLSLEVHPFSVVQPAWSPDGRRLLFVAMSGSLHTTSRVWSVLEDGTDLRAVSDESSANLQPVWIGDSVFFLSDRAGSADVYVQAVTPDGARKGDARPITIGVGIGSFAISRDAQRIVYSKGVERSNIWTAPLELASPIAWLAAKPLSAENQSVEFLDVSSDGQWIVIDSTRDGKSHLWKMRVDGTGGPQKITDGAGEEWHPSLSPDNTRVAFHALRDGNRDIFTASIIDGGSLRQLTDHPAKDWLPRWSPDGRWIAFVSDRGGNQDVFLIPSVGGEARPLAADPANDHNPLWSRDGQTILFASNRGGDDDLFVVSVDGGAARQVTHQAWADLVPLTLAPDGGSVHVWARSRSRSIGYWTIRLSDGAVEPFLAGGFTSHQLGMSAVIAGRRLLFPVWERTADLWLGELSTSFPFRRTIPGV